MLKVLIWGESFSGYGHLDIIKQISKAFLTKAHDVLVASGTARNVPEFFSNINVAHLPLVQIAKAETGLVYVDERGLSVNQSNVMQRRRDELIKLHKTFQPDVIITEQWPHSRGQFDSELLPLLREASLRELCPLIVNVSTDVRSDNSVYGLGGREEFIYRVKKIFDRVAILSDEAILDYTQTCPMYKNYDQIYHVGFLGPELPDRKDMLDEERPILISAGVAPFPEALELFYAMIKAWPHSEYKHHPWHIIASHNLKPDDIQELQKYAAQIAGEKIKVETTRPDFFNLLSNCKMSVSLAGYSTLMAVLKLGIPNLVYPAGPEGYTEHQARVRALADSNFINILDRSDINDPAVLTKKMHMAISSNQSKKKEHFIEERSALGVYPGVDLLKVSALEFTLAQSDDALREEFGYSAKKIRPRMNGADQLVWLVEDTIAIREPWRYRGFLGTHEARSLLADLVCSL